MRTNRSERSGSLILRVWTEARTDAPLRARIIEVSQSERKEREVAMTASASEACEMVCAWLEAFVEDA